MQELKVGDKVIYTYNSWHSSGAIVRTVSKVNKATYTLDSGVLLYKYDLRERKHRDAMSRSDEKYQVYTDEAWHEASKKANDVRFKKWKDGIERYGLGDAECMKRYIEEQEVKEAVK